MLTLSFYSFAQVDNVLSQLPDAARRHGSGVIVTPRLSKDFAPVLVGYDLTVPDEFAVAAQSADPSVHAPRPTETQAREECARRISALASEATQRNLAGYMALLGLKQSLTTEEQADVAAFALAMQWIGAMRANWRALVDAADEDWRDDSKWPTCPPAAVTLAARF